MGNQQFLGKILGDDQSVVSFMGPSGTGKSFSAEFLQDYLEYKIARQITTRSPRPDDKHYNYMSKEDFIRLESEKKILGFFSGDKEKLTGNGYGYLIEELGDEIITNKKIILFPSPYELEEFDFKKKYGTTDKIGLGFKNAQMVRARAEQCGKIIDEKELESRVYYAELLTHIMEKYAKCGDLNFNLLYSDNGLENLLDSKKKQISDIITCVGYNAIDFNDKIEEYILR